jgi:superfamily II DNA or RNA helicase
VARLNGFEPLEEKLQKALSFIDQRVDFELQKTKKSIKRFTSPYLKPKLLESWGKEKYDNVVAELEAKRDVLTKERKKCLLFKDERGLWTYSGLGHRLAAAGKCKTKRTYFIPAPNDNLPYTNLPKFEDRPYQVEAHDLLLANGGEGPCGIELPTGAGKSTIIRNVLKTLALPAVVMAPSLSIAGQLFDDLTYYFGKKYVGMFGDGKKQFDRMFVVGIDDSLAKVEPGTEAWEALSKKHVFFADESHLTPANSLQKVCFGLLKDAPWRFFCSATQMRNDGLDLVLDGITGRIVLRKEARELIDAGYLAKPVFKIVKVRSYSNVRSDDANRMTREHLFYNPIVARVAAELANRFVSEMKRPTVILVEELEQFRELLPHFKHLVRFAHGPLDKTKKKLVPEEYQSKDNKILIAQFNAGQIPILVGTSCIATGTDIQVAEAGIYLMGGKSEIKVKQGIGRMTRGGFAGKVMNPWTGAQKLDAIWVDFNVTEPGANDKDPWTPSRHLAARAGFYADIYEAAKVIDYTHLK